MICAETINLDIGSVQRTVASGLAFILHVAAKFARRALKDANLTNNEFRLRLHGLL